MKWLPLLALLVAAPVCAQSFRGVDQRAMGVRLSGAATGDLSGTWQSPIVSKVNRGSIPTSAVALGSNGSNQIVSATVQGSGDSKVQLASGSVTNGHCPQYDSNGGLVDSGATCGNGNFNNATASTVTMVNYGGL